MRLPDVLPPDLRERLAREGRVVLTVKAIPKSSRDEIAAVLEDGSLKVKVTAAPEKGKANLAICAVLAAAFDVPRGNVEIVRGANAALKHVVISGG